MLVLDEREPHVAVAVLAEPDAGRDRDAGLLDQMLRKFEGAHLPERLGYLRPDEHRGLGLLDAPARLVQPFKEHVPPRLVHAANVLHALLRPVERNDGRDLDGLEHAVVQIALDLDEGAHDVLVPAAEAHAPAGHIVALGEAEEFHTHVLGPFRLEEARRPVAVEVQVRIGQVMDHDDIVLPGEIGDLLEEGKVHHRRRRVVREIDDEHLGPRPGVLVRLLHIGEEVAVFPERDGAHLAAGDDHGIGMDGIGGRGGEHHVSRFNRRERQMGQSFLGSDGHHGLRLGVEVDIVAPLIPVTDGRAELGDAFGRGITVVLGVLGRLDELVHDVLRRGLVGVAHAEVDDVLSAPARLDLHGVHDRKNIRRQPFDPAESLWHRHPLLFFGEFERLTEQFYRVKLIIKH